ncbi:MAG: DUF11 domain-containing protein [Clostridia bacterium]|nr:DUF11 domain-containing protein [Clostridia bacterium]
MKKTLASILSLTLFLGMLGWILLPSASGAATEQYAGIGEYTVRLDADPTTDTIPTEFGTTAADGKVWADKSVTVREDRFEVTLSALAQEYISESEGATASSTAADVVMILDLSGSMQDKNLTLDTVSMTRTKAMVKAVNEATEIMMAANPQNRLLIYTYQSDSTGKSPTINEFLPLGHYSNTNWSNEDPFSGNSGKYFNYVVSGEEGGIQTATNLKKDNATFSKKTQYTQYGTCTQHGILKGIQALIDAIGKETKTVERKPYVLLFTDGAPGNAAKSWYDTTSSSCSFTHQNNGSSEITATTLLSAALMKDRLNAAYQAYNGKAQGIEWFNIGLGVGDLNQSKLFLQPANIAADTTTDGQNIRKYISTYTGGTYAEYSHYATNYVYTVDSYLADTGDELQQAFNTLAERIEEETKTITFPILSAEGATSDLIFTDTMGDGMTVSDITLHPAKSTAVRGVAAGNTYSFEGFDLTVTMSADSQGRQVLQWNIPADEVAIFSFADRQNPANGEYTSAEPLQLTYQVSMASEQDYAGQNTYSNHSATARFSIASDNIYYYETDSTLKAAPFAAQAKVSNPSQTDANAVSYSTASIQNGTTVTAALGNNGRLAPAALLEKQAENALIAPDGIVDFELKITNKGETALSNVVIKDTLPAALTYCNGSAQNASVSADGAELTFTVPHIDAGASLSVTYQAILSADAEHGSTHTNLAAITRINEVDVYGPISEQSTVTAHHTHRVLYDWSGDIPNGQTLPSDENLYTPGAYYEIDTTYTEQTVIEKKDAFGNVSDRWTFSGWTDPNGGIMGDADVTVYGVWSHQPFTIPAYKVTYTWSGNIPNAATLPTDPHTYVTNQPYPIDPAYQAGTVIPHTDPYGNVNGKYTFSGWADPNNGVMGDEDVTIPGVWNYQPTDVPTHRVLYDWTGAIPAGEILPIDPNAYVKNQPYAVDTAYTAQTTVQSFDAFGNVNGKYTFSGWEDPNNGVMGDADITVRGVWSFEAVNVPAHRVIYEWSGTIPASETLPADPNSYVKNQPYGIDATYTSATVIPAFDAFGNLNGKYTFSGWTDPNNGVMGDEDITIRGVWAFEAVNVPAHKVIYEWSGEIPAGETLPTDGNSYVKNQNYTVDTVYTAATEIPTFDAFGNVNGKYTFSGWADPNRGVMGEADVLIQGEWAYQSVLVPAYRVLYEWEGTIPMEAMLPMDENVYVPNQPYAVDAAYTAQTTVQSFDAFGNVNGIYSFSGWTDPNNGVMGNEDVTVRGIWNYQPTEVPAHNVLYEWSGDIPAGETLPTDPNAYVKNQTYAVDATYTDQTTVQSFDASGNLNGVYSFSGWTDPNSGIMDDEDITIRGIWTYEAQDLPLFPDPEIPPEEITPDPDPLPEEEQPLPEDGQAPDDGQTPDEEQPSSEEPLPDEEQTPEPKPEEPANPYTGDVPIELFYLLWISSAAALILLIPLRKK